MSAKEIIDIACEYECTDCGYRFAISEHLGTPEGGRPCPRCGSIDTQIITVGDGISCGCRSCACCIDD